MKTFYAVFTYLRQFFFGYRINPSTLVKIWLVESYPVGGRVEENITLFNQYVWSKYEQVNRTGLIISLLNKDYDESEVVNLLFLTPFDSKNPSVIPLSDVEFDKFSNNIPVRSVEERNKWFEQVIKELKNSAEQRLAAINNLIKKIEEVKQKLQSVVNSINKIK